MSQKHRDGFLIALLKEIELQKNFFFAKPGEPSPFIDTLYLGGGTPSLLSRDELRAIMDTIRQYFLLKEGAEITLEGNPDDLTLDKLQVIKDIGVNRLSIGIQSFHEADLRYMNRSHTSQQAKNVLAIALKEGFQNITADLIYGTPGMSDSQWQENIMELANTGIPHISAYSLTVEKKTALDVFIRQGKAAPVEEEQSVRQFDILRDIASRYGYDHYEFSNFGKPGFYSKHNLSYWSGEPYLGLGPSAHSYIPGTRQWNVAHTQKYILSLKEDRIPSESEILSPDQQYNEYIMTSLRTMWGAEKDKVAAIFGGKYYENMMRQAKKHLQSGTIADSGTHLIITEKGKFLADGIAADLFI